MQSILCSYPVIIYRDKFINGDNINGRYVDINVRRYYNGVLNGFKRILVFDHG